VRWLGWFWDKEELRVVEGDWDGLPDKGVLKLIAVNFDGLSLEISGFDRYYYNGTTLGGVTDGPSPWPRGAHFSCGPGRRIAHAEGERGRPENIPGGAPFKHGATCPDEIARAVGIL
jgi:hypothetical protein